jgi:hypothetical protein
VVFKVKLAPVGWQLGAQRLESLEKRIDPAPRNCWESRKAGASAGTLAHFLRYSSTAVSVTRGGEEFRMDVALAVGLRTGAEFLGRNDLIVTIVLANVSHHFAAVGADPAEAGIRECIERVPSEFCGEKRIGPGLEHELGYAG